MSVRKLTPEILDELPADHPDAVASRRDLRWINTVMGNHAWILDQLQRSAPGDTSIVELGAGDGTLAHAWVRQNKNPAATWTAVDMAESPTDWDALQNLYYVQQNLLDPPPANLKLDVVVANLILHHFTDSELAEIGRLWMQDAQWILVREPLRSRAMMRFVLYPLGLNRVTRHDMRVSIEAGFRQNELPLALGLSEDWSVKTRHTQRGAYEMCAHKRTIDASTRVTPE